MPLLTIHTLQGHTPEYKKTLLNCIHTSLMEALGIADWDRFQKIIEYSKEDFETAPEKSNDFMIIEMTIFPGRSREQKKKAIELITESLVRELKIEPTDVFIVIHEPPLENWGMGGHQKG